MWFKELFLSKTPTVLGLAIIWLMAGLLLLIEITGEVACLSSSLR
jgi:hypothetical protein